MVFFKKHYGFIGLVILLVVFVCCKLPILHTPYFWDELGVYAPGALKMKDNGTISLLPSSLEPLYSRGHPLLFYFCYASVYAMFGDGVAVGHAFAIFLGCMTLISFYLIAKNLFGTLTALVATVLLSAQPIFFAMSGVVLPEMLLTLSAVIAIWAFIRQRWWVYFVASSLAMLTKESALVIPAVTLTYLFFDGIFQKDFFSPRRFRNYIFAAVPLFVYALFLFIQKKQNGWYFFPEHVGYIRFDFEGVKSWSVYAIQDFFRRQGRWFETLFFIIVVIQALRVKNVNPVLKRTVIVSLLFIFFSLAFACTNFYLTRYILYVIPLVILIGSYGIVSILERVPSLSVRYGLIALAAVAGCLLSIRKMDTKTFQDTSDMAYLHVVNCVQESIKWTEQQPWKDSLIEAEFPVFQAVRDTRNGYLSGKPFNYSVNYEKKARYGVLFHLNDDAVPVWNGSKYHVIKSFDDLFAHVSVVEFE